MVPKRSLRATRLFDGVLQPELVQALKVNETILPEHANLINQRRNTPDGESTSGESDQKYLVFAVVEVEVVAYEAVCIADVGMYSCGSSADVRRGRQPMQPDLYQ